MNKSYKLRTSFIFLLYIVLFCIAFFHLYIIQIRQHTFFVDLGNRQYYVTLTIDPPRAHILDRYNQALALNKESLAAFILPQTIKDQKKLTRFLRNYFPQTYKRLKEHPKARFLYVKRRLSGEEQKFIESQGLEDVFFLNEPNRFYPIEETGSLTGITDIDNIGLFGIEMMYQKQLAGTPNTYNLERDARSGQFYFSKKITQKGTEGKSVQLTIDGQLQFLVQEELNASINKYQAKEGAVIVMDPQTGDILAMASYPSFNPNDTRNLEQYSTKNTAITESYEFGSAMKSFTALAALEEKLVTPDEEIDCGNAKTSYVDGRKVNTVEAQGIVPFTQVIMRSNNIGIAKVAKRLGPKLYYHYKKLGFGTKIGIFPGEQHGFVNPPSHWSKHSIISLSYGYEITTTLLQLARAFSVFANNGSIVKPRLILDESVQPEMSAQLYSPETIETMRMILLETTSKQGMAHRSAIPGYTVMGKTSTANLIVDGQYRNDKNLYGFVGIIEKDSYKRVIACFMKDSPHKNLYAGTVAAPLFQKVAEKTVLHEKVW